MFKSESQKKKEQLKEKLIKKCKDLNVDVINKKSGKLLSLNTLKTRCGGGTYARRINEIGDDIAEGKVAVMNQDISVKKWLKKQKEKVKEDKSKNVYFTQAPPIEIYYNNYEEQIERNERRKTIKSKGSRGSTIPETEPMGKRKAPIIFRQPDVIDEFLDPNVPLYINENDIAVYRDGYATADYRDKMGRLRRKTKKQLEIENEIRKKKLDKEKLRRFEEEQRKQEEQMKKDRKDEQGEG